MSQHSIEIEGIEELMTKLAALGGDVPTAIHKGLMRGGRLVQKDAKMLCPVDTGVLRNSIAVVDISKGEVQVGTNVEYAPYVEFGTGQRGDPSVAHSSEVAGQAPQPFLGPALAMTEHRIREEVASALEKTIREVMKGG